MELTDVLLPLLVAMVTASWANLHARLGKHEGHFARIESRLSRIEAELAKMPSREEFDAFRAEMRADFDSFRGEIRADTTAQRTDITQIALAVGAGRPQATEG